MINKTTINAIAPLVGTFSKTPLALVPVSESILSALCTASNYGLATEYSAEVGFHEEWLASLRNATVYGTNEPIAIHDVETGSSKYLPSEMHDKTIEEAANVVADAVVRGINYTKTVVKPTINNFLEVLEAELEVKGAIRSPFNIIPVESSKAWDSKLIEMALAPLIASQKPIIVTRSRIPNIAFDEQFLEDATTGNKRLDAELDNILKEKSLSRLDIARVLFSSQNEVGAFSQYVRTEGDLYLARFILVNMLADNPPSIKMSLKEWQQLMLNLSQALGAMCGLHMRVMEDFRRPKNVVMDARIDAQNIYVDAQTYDAWLDAGGSPEVLMGCMMQRVSKQQQLTATVDELNAGEATYRLTHSRFHASEEHAERGRRVIRTRDALRKAMSDTLGGVDISLMPQGTDLNIISKNANMVITKLPEYKLEDFGMLGTKLVCEMIYPFTNSMDILGRMTGFINDGKTPQEAERLTVMDYITDWSLDAINVG